MFSALFESALKQTQGLHTRATTLLKSRFWAVFTLSPALEHGGIYRPIGPNHWLPWSVHLSGYSDFVVGQLLELNSNLRLFFTLSVMLYSRLNLAELTVHKDAVMKTAT